MTSIINLKKYPVGHIECLAFPQYYLLFHRYLLNEWIFCYYHMLTDHKADLHECIFIFILSYGITITTHTLLESLTPSCFYAQIKSNQFSYFTNSTFISIDIEIIITSHILSGCLLKPAHSGSQEPSVKFSGIL